MNYVLIGRVGEGHFFITGVFNDRYIHVPYDCNTARIKRYFEGWGGGGPGDNFISRVAGTEVVYYIQVCEL